MKNLIELRGINIHLVILFFYCIFNDSVCYSEVTREDKLPSIDDRKRL